MRKSFQFAVVMAAALGLAGAAQGAVLTSARIRVPLGESLIPQPITGTGVGTSLGLGATATLSSNILQGVASATGITAAPPVTQVILSLAGHVAGNFTPTGGPGGGLGGPMTLGGALTVNAYSGMVILLSVPLSPVGQPGGFDMWTGTYTGPGGPTLVQVSGTGWTTGSWTLMAPLTTIGGATYTDNVATVTATGADLRTASGAGTLVLITPLFVRSNLAGDQLSFATLTLNYVPEPATLLLVGLGIAGLALRGRRKA